MGQFDWGMLLQGVMKPVPSPQGIPRKSTLPTPAQGAELVVLVTSLTAKHIRLVFQ